MSNNLLGYNLDNHSDGEAFIIAEAGINHDGDFDKARELIDIAADAGCSCVKFQSFKTDNTSSPKAITAPYIEAGSKKDETFYQLSKRLELSFDEQKELSRYSKLKKIQFASSHFDEESLEFLVELCVPFLKVASGEMTNFPLLKKAVETKLPIIMSTGMATLDEIDEVIEFVKGHKIEKLFLMHCVSIYPTDYNLVNLQFIDSLAKRYKIPIGFSDHTLGISAPIAARARGVKFFEKHYTISKNDFGPDHFMSLTPDELESMVTSINQVNLILGKKEKTIGPIELQQRNVHRKSVVVAKNLKKGHIVSSGDLILRKPGLGISPKYIDDLIGYELLEGIEDGSCLTWDMVKKL